MKITSIHQPSFFPWLGLLDKIAKSNFFVFLDHVSVNKGSFQYRNLFYCNGVAKYITLPVDISINKQINQLKFTNNRWAEEHIEKLKNYYRKAQYFQEIFPIIENFYSIHKNKSPNDVMVNSMKLMFNIFGINVEYEFSSRLACEETKGYMVLEICKKLDADFYLSGRGAADYMDDMVLKSFAKAGIGLTWHNFTHPEYCQMAKFEFVSGLSSLDILFFHGVYNSRAIFWNNVNTSKLNEQTES